VDDIQPPQPPAQPPARKLYRSRTQRMLGGVCGGLAEYFNIDVTLVRVLFVAFAVLTGGIGALIYLVLWIVLPESGGDLRSQGPIGG
jgi:phage shock protein C